MVVANEACFNQLCIINEHIWILLKTLWNPLFHGFHQFCFWWYSNGDILMVIYDQAGWQCQRRPYPLISVATIWTMDPLFPTFSPPFYSSTRKEDGQYYTVKCGEMGDITQCCVGYKSHITQCCVGYKSRITQCCVGYKSHITQCCVGYKSHITQCCVRYRSHITSYYPYRGRGRLGIIQYGRKGKCLVEILQNIGICF